MNEIYTLVEKLKNAPDFIDLTDSNFGRPQFFSKTAKDILKTEFSQYLNQRHYQPDSKGNIDARVAIADYYHSQRKFSVDPEKIIITASTSESYNLLFQSLAKQGDEVLIPIPGYPLFEYIITANHLKSNTYALNQDNAWQPDIEELTKKITTKTKFLILISPNNPTGSVIRDENFEKIFELCAKTQTKIVIDEVFIDFSDCKTDFVKLANTYKVETILLNGISKLLSLPDMKLAWITILNDQLLELISEIELMNDMYLSANSYIQFALPELLKQIKTIQEPTQKIIIHNREVLAEAFSNSQQFSFVQPKGGIHAFIGINKNSTKFKSEDELCLTLLNKHKILLHPGYFYDFSDNDHLWLSLSYLCDSSTILRFKEALSNIMDWPIQ
jgi:aspartate/methionine/tyrosine aminotransferase